MDPPYYGGLLVLTETTGPNKTRQMGDAILTLSLAITYLHFIYLIDSIVTSFLLLYPTRNALPVVPSIPIINTKSHISSWNKEGDNHFPHKSAHNPSLR